MASIWHTDEVQDNYSLTKQETTFSKWRVLVMERLAQIAEIDEDDAVARIALYGLERLGLEFDADQTADEVARKLSKHKYRAF